MGENGSSCCFLPGIMLCCSCSVFYSKGNFSQFSFRIKTLRGMRTARIRKMAAAAAALRRECVLRHTLFYGKADTVIIFRWEQLKKVSGYDKLFSI